MSSLAVNQEHTGFQNSFQTNSQRGKVFFFIKSVKKTWTSAFGKFEHEILQTLNLLSRRWSF